MVTLVPLLIALALLLVVSVAPFVGASLLLVSLVALLTWGVWKAAANLLGLTGENVFRLAQTPELFGAGGPDDPDWMFVPRQRSPQIQAEPLQQSVVATESSEPTEVVSARWRDPSPPTQTKGATMRHHVDTVDAGPVCFVGRWHR